LFIKNNDNKNVTEDDNIKNVFFFFFLFLLIDEWQTFIEKRKGKETKVHSKLHEQTEGTKSKKKKKIKKRAK
jgi:hypothetical protein